MWKLIIVWSILILLQLITLCALPQSAPKANVAVGAGRGSAGVAQSAIAIAPVPPVIGISGVCNEDGATGFINDTCQTDSDCYDANAMTCKSKRCQCGPNYVEDQSSSNRAKQRICAPIPSLFSPCTSVCQKPYECKTGVMEIPGVGMDMAPFQERGSGKTCQCPGNSKYINGYCDAGCKSDQRIGPGGKCVARCTSEQVLIDNECKQLAGLSDSCDDNAQCKASFSSCQNGRCACANGFSAQGGKCQTRAYNCPYGDPLLKGASVVLCDASPQFSVCMGGMCPMAASAERGKVMPAAPVASSANAGSSSIPFVAKPYKTDGCPSSHYCHTYDFSGPSSRGHCCPKPAARCPVGEPHPTAKCNGGNQGCPYNTHMCLSTGAPNGYSDQLCCPKPCQGYDKVFVKDQCLPMVQYGDGCQYNEQCTQISGICKGGKCTCPPKSTAIDGGGQNKFCQLNCGSDEVPFGNECKSTLNLGDSCAAEGSFCPSGAYCNRKGVCACMCGYRKTSSKSCIPPEIPMQPMPVPMGAPGGAGATGVVASPGMRGPIGK